MYFLYDYDDNNNMLAITSRPNIHYQFWTTLDTPAGQRISSVDEHAT